MGQLAADDSGGDISVRAEWESVRERVSSILPTPTGDQEAPLC